MLKRILFLAGLMLVSTAAIYPASPILKRAELGFAVSSNAYLQNLKSTEFTSVWRLGYSAMFDSPSVTYQSTNAACSLNSGNGDNGSQVKLADGNCAVAILGRDPSPKIFGAKIDGSTDDSAAVQALGKYLCTADGELVFPAGTIKAHDINFPCGLKVRGMGKARTTLDISAAVNYGLQWEAPGFPGNGSAGLMYGGSLEDIKISDTVSSAKAIQVEGVFGWTSRNIYLNNPYIGVYIFGDNDVTLENYQSQGVRNTAYYLKGDITGVDGTNTACTTSTLVCTTELTLVTLRNLNNGVTLGSTAIGLKIEGFVNTVDGEHFAFENYGQGLAVSCPAGMNANMTQCPHFIFIHDFQNENFHTYGVNATDFINMKLTVPYLYGDGSAANVNNMYLACTNYCGSSVSPGLVTVRDGYIFATQQDCIATAGTNLADLNFFGNQIYGCGLANTGSGGINLQNTMLTFHIQDNQFCQVDGYVPGTPPAYGVRVGANASGGIIKGNSFWNCARNIINNSTRSYTIIGDGNIGPGVGPTVSTCGTSTITGTDNDFTITAGGSPSTCQVNFGAQMMRTPVCVASTTSGSSTSVVATNPQATGVGLNFGAALIGSVQVHCSTGG